MTFAFLTPPMERLSWTFPEFFGKCLLIRAQLSLPYICLNVLEFRVSTGLWSSLCPQPCKNDSQFIELKRGVQPKAKRTVGMTNVGQVSHTDANRRQESSSPNDATWNNREPLETENLCSPLCLISHGGALCFSIGDHAGINCQTCLTPPCHLIIACNTPEC